MASTQQQLAQMLAGPSPMMMPSYSPTDFYKGSMAPPTSSNGILTPTPLGSQSSSTGYAAGSIDPNKSQSQFPSGTASQPLDFLSPPGQSPTMSASTGTGSGLDPYGYSWAPGMGFAQANWDPAAGSTAPFHNGAPGIPAGGGLPGQGVTLNPQLAQTDPWAGARIGPAPSPVRGMATGGLASLPSQSSAATGLAAINPNLTAYQRSPAGSNPAVHAALMARETPRDQLITAGNGKVYSTDKSGNMFQTALGGTSGSTGFRKVTR